MEKDTIYNGDALDILRSWPAEIVHCVVTSPPYWGLRDYGTSLWDGGSPSCNHKVGRFEYPVSSKQASNRASAGHQAREICPKCGAVRIDKQLGLEKTPEEYTEKMVEIFREVRRVMRPDATLWLNMGDCFTSGNRPDRDPGLVSKTSGLTNRSAGLERAKTPAGLKPKDLVGLPWRLAFALQSDGWWLRSD